MKKKQNISNNTVQEINKEINPKESNNDEDYNDLNNNIKKNTSDKKILELEQQLEEKNDQLLRLQAEFINFRNRVEQEKIQTRATVVADVLKEFVCVFDDFQTALEHSKLNENEKKGFELVFAKLISAGENLGLKKIPTVKEIFNPNFHEVLLTEICKDITENEIIAELQPGYMVNNKVIRTAKVKVGIKK
jgi:molecular chaperone GrpE